VELVRREDFGVGEREKEVIGEEYTVVDAEGCWEVESGGGKGGVRVKGVV